MSETVSRRSNVWLPLPIGTRVKPTELAIERLIARPEQRGVVVGGSRHGERIRVLRDGLKTVVTYSVHFWEIDR